MVIGGGPGGCTAGILLVQAGLAVAIVEKESFPRFHIGESLLPRGNDLLRKIGVFSELEERGCVAKWGAEFLNYDGSCCVHNVFAEGLVSGLDYTYQVERAVFDDLLLARAKEAGVEVFQPSKVLELTMEEESCHARIQNEGEKEEWSLEAEWVIDASGQNRFLGKKLRLPQEEGKHPKRIAVFNHFTGVARKEGREGGNILITRFAQGWSWQIPISGEVTSVGVVTTLADKKRYATNEELFSGKVEESPFLADCLREAQARDSFRAIEDYSYTHETFADKRYFLVGDAAAFIDPIFSSGVYLAMESASLCAQKIIALRTSASPRKRLKAQKEYTKTLKGRMRVMRQLVDVFYDDDRFHVFMNPSNRFRLFDAVNAIVAGNTKLPFRLWWRYVLFLRICRVQKHLHLVPPVRLRAS